MKKILLTAAALTTAVVMVMTNAKAGDDWGYGVAAITLYNRDCQKIPALMEIANAAIASLTKSDVEDMQATLAFLTAMERRDGQASVCKMLQGIIIKGIREATK